MSPLESSTKGYQERQEIKINLDRSNNSVSNYIIINYLLFAAGLSDDLQGCL